MGQSTWHSRLLRVGRQYYAMVPQSIPGMDDRNVLHRTRVAVVNFDVDSDGETMAFCQQGFGEYLVDHVVVIDNGPVGGRR